MAFVPFNNSANQSGVNRNEKFSKLSNKSLIFPQDMEKAFYPEAIKFSVYERSGVNYDKVKGLLTNAASTTFNFAKADKDLFTKNRKVKSIEPGAAGSDAAIKDAAAAQLEFDNRNNKRAEKLELLREDFPKLLEENRKEQKLEKTLDRHLQSIYLAMPESVNFAEGIDWQGSDLGVIGGLKSGAINDLGDALNYGVLTGAGAALGGAAGLAASLIPGVSGIAGTIVGAVLGGSGLQSGIESTLGVKTNPFKEQTFQGVGFRPFDFTFNFRARSQSDVIVIQDIIRAFRSYSKPTFKDAEGAIFKYPKEFRIEFLTIDNNNSYVTNKYIPEIKFCVCTAINTNFTAQGWKSFEGGAPVDISLQITFQETEIITGEDVDGQTDIGRFSGYEGKF